MRDKEVTSFVKTHAPEVIRQKVAYSVLFGGYDSLPKVENDDNIDYIIFTDSLKKVPMPWQVVLVDSNRFGIKKTSRYFKSLAHYLFPMAKQSIYFDSSFTFINPLNQLLQDYRDVRFGLFNHPYHRDFLDEAAACARQGKANASVIERQIADYKSAGLPELSGCYAGGVLLRNLQDSAVKSVNETWCVEIARWSERDQISLPYAFWLCGLQPDIIEGDIFFNKYLVPRAHLSSRLTAKIKRSIAIKAYKLGIYKS